jgi:hypothetical protein
VANRVGASAKHELTKVDFEKGIGGALAGSVAYAPDVFMQVGTPVGAIKHKQHAAAKAVQLLASILVPEIVVEEDKPKSLLSFLGKREKD